MAMKATKIFKKHVVYINVLVGLNVFSFFSLVYTISGN